MNISEGITDINDNQISGNVISIVIYYLNQSLAINYIN